MTHDLTNTSTILPATTNPLATPDTATNTREDGWTPDKQAIFLQALASTHCVAKAARAAGMSRQSAYKLRARLKGEPFDYAWAAALQCRMDALAEAAFERALNGVEVPHYYRGELVGTSRKYDERLTVALLAMRSAFVPPRMPQWHGSAHYAPDDFARLVERVETGPETWDEEARLAIRARLEEDEEEGSEDWDPEQHETDDHSSGF